MARIRTIKHDLYLDEELAQCSIPARYLFPGLWTLADREGRLEDRPIKIKAQLYPYDKVDIDKLLNELAAVHAIIRYTIGNRNYIQIRTFSQHQNINQRETESSIPEPPAESTEMHMHAYARTCTHMRASGERINGVTELRSNGVTDNSTEQPAENAGDSALPAFDETIPLNDGTEFAVPLSRVEEWQRLYPNADVRQELREMRGWCLGNPKKRKTRNGVLKFITGWLARAQDGNHQARASPEGEQIDWDARRRELIAVSKRKEVTHAGG